MAAIAIFAGLMLITAGFLGGPRWLILPVTVLVLPLAVVSAADIDLTGGAGESAYRPATVAAAQARVPPRRRPAWSSTCAAWTCPPGRTEVKLSSAWARRRSASRRRVRLDPGSSAPARPTALGREQGTNLGLDHAAAGPARRDSSSTPTSESATSSHRPLGGPCA